MDRRTRNLFLLVLVGFVAVAGGAAFLLGSSEIRDPAVPSGTSTAVGVITHLDQQGLGAVQNGIAGHRSSELHIRDLLFVGGRLAEDVQHVHQQ